MSDNIREAATSRRSPSPHREADGLCTRCQVRWPCRSIVLGRDVPPSWASIDDLRSVDPVLQRIALAVLRGKIMDTGERSNGANGQEQMLYVGTHNPEAALEEEEAIIRWPLAPGSQHPTRS